MPNRLLSAEEVIELIMEKTGLTQEECEDIYIELCDEINNYLDGTSAYESMHELVGDFLFGDVQVLFHIGFTRKYNDNE